MVSKKERKMEKEDRELIAGRFELKNKYLKNLLTLLRSEFPETAKDEEKLAVLANHFYAPHI